MITFSSRHSRYLGRLVLVSVLAAAATVILPLTETIDLNAPETGAFLAGFHPARETAELAGRWTAGEGRITLPVTAASHPRVRLDLVGHPDRPGDRLEVVIDGVTSQEVELDGGSRRVEVVPRPRSGEEPLVLSIRSSTTRASESAPPLGVGVERVEIRSGGLAEIWRPGWAFTGAALVFMAILVGLGPAARDAGRPVAWLPAVGGVGLALLCFVLLRAELITSFRGLGLCSAAALAYRALLPEKTRSLVRAACTRTCDGVGLPLFVGGAATLLLLGLFREAIVDGKVLSQATLLFQFYPWAAHRPPAVEAGNSLMGDVPMQFYPFYLHAARTVREGQLPLWNSSIYAGAPFIGAFQTAVFSIFTAIAYVVPLPEATVWMAVTRLLVGGGGMFLFIRALGLSGCAATFAGVAYLLNPFAIVWLEHPHSAVAAWLPWLLWSMERLVQRQRWRDAMVQAVLVGTTLLAGHPETALTVLLFSALYGLVRIAGMRERVRGVWLIGVGQSVGVLLASIQLLPFVEYLFVSHAYAFRQQLDVNPYALPIHTIVTAIVPNFYGNPAHGTALDGGVNFNEQIVYPGIVTWLLGAVGVLRGPSDRRLWFFVALVPVALGVMYGAPGLLSVVSALPLLEMTAISRFGLLAITGIIVLAAYGADLVVGRPTRGSDRTLPRSRTVVVAVGMVLGAALLMIGWYMSRGPLIEGSRHAAFAGFYVTVAVLLLVAGFGAIVGRALGILSQMVGGFAVMGLLVIDLLLFAQEYHPLVPPDQVFPPVPEIDAVASDPDLFRVAAWGNNLLPNAAMAYGLQDFRGYDAMGPIWYTGLLDAAFDFDGSFHHATRFEAAPLLDLLNVKYVFVRPGIRLPGDRFTRIEEATAPVYRNDRAFPRTFLTDGYRVVTGNPARRALRDGSLDFTRMVLLAEEPEVSHRPEIGEADDVGLVAVRRYEDAVVELDTSADGARLLVLTDLYYPGWVATVDDRVVPIYRANFAFRAVPVPPGDHIVRFRYQPTSFRAGRLLSGLGLIVVVLVGWRSPSVDRSS